MAWPLYSAVVFSRLITLLQHVCCCAVCVSALFYELEPCLFQRYIYKCRRFFWLFFSFFLYIVSVIPPCFFKVILSCRLYSCWSVFLYTIVVDKSEPPTLQSLYVGWSRSTKKTTTDKPSRAFLKIKYSKHNKTYYDPKKSLSFCRLVIKACESSQTAKSVMWSSPAVVLTERHGYQIGIYVRLNKEIHSTRCWLVRCISPSKKKWSH